MSEDRPRKSRGPAKSKNRTMKKKYDDDEGEEEVDENPIFEQQVQQSPQTPPMLQQYAEKKERPRGKIMKKGYESEEVDVQPFFEQKQQQKPSIKMPPLPTDFAQKKERPRDKVKKKSYATEEMQNDDYNSFDEQEEQQIIKMPPIRQQNAPYQEHSKGRMMKNYDSGDDADDVANYDSLLENISQKAMKMPVIQQGYASKKQRPPMEKRGIKFASEPITKSEPANRIARKGDRPLPNRIQQKKQAPQYQMNNYDYENDEDEFQFDFPVLPPILTTENLTDILQTILPSPTVKAFKVKLID